MTDNLQVRIDAALASVRNNRLGVNILAAGMVRDSATTTDGKVRFAVLLSAADDATIVRDARQAVQQVDGVTEVRIDVRDAAQPHGAEVRAAKDNDALAAKSGGQAPKTRALPVMGQEPQ